MSDGGRSDDELVDLARRGDKDAFGVLVDRCQPMAERVARGVVGHPDTAREMVQEAVLHAYLSLDRLRQAERFRSWLHGIVLNVCRTHLRSARRDTLSLETLAGGLRFDAIPFVGAEPSAQEAAEAQELHQTVLRSVNSLTPKNRCRDPALLLRAAHRTRDRRNTWYLGGCSERPSS